MLFLVPNTANWSWNAPQSPQTADRLSFDRQWRSHPMPLLRPQRSRNWWKF